MKYTKKLLSRENRDYSSEVFYGTLFEMLNNEKTLEEYVEQILTSLNKIEGPIHVVRRNAQSIDFLTESEEYEKDKVMNSEVYKKIKETKKPFFFHNLSEEGDEYYAGFPLNLKGKFVGAVLVEKKQEIKQWKEIYVALHMLVFGFRYFTLIEKEREMNIRDVITGLYNEKYFYTHLEIEQEKYRRYKTPMTLVLFELKNFAKIADEYGFEVGEKILQNLGAAVAKQSRSVDMPARIERGLFAVLLSNSPELGGEAIANRVNRWIGDVVEVNGKEVKIDVGYSYVEYQYYHTRESFFTETYDKLKKEEQEG
ncbi:MULTISPECIES: GGDEF domain-containing protein [Bacillus cereus group]|uniref:GGDEF domain-containing protein n=1 Tax=Bacillus cereus group TaxID=86661 RepID=UPI0022E0CBC9|nr:GGDEF domain-containing protein [Bacillus cereus group sp. TH152-1LC]MDA1674822.1 GGDEF domain-containing protein [Bacillus cereus group sp. TH152-1LC]